MRTHWLSATALFALLLAPLPAQADDVSLVFTAADTSDAHAPVLSYLYRQDQNGRTAKMTSTGQPQSRFDYTESDCSPLVRYEVLPIAPSLYTFQKDDWRGCAKGQTYEYTFARNVQDASAATTYSLFSGTFSGGGGPLDPGLASIQAAVAKGDLGTVSFLSTEMNAALLKNGATDAAKPFQFLALASGFDAVAAQEPDTATPAQPFVTNGSPNGIPVLSDDAAAFIKQYQLDQKLPNATGAVDWPTIRSASKLANQNIDALSSQRVEAITPILASPSRLLHFNAM